MLCRARSVALGVRLVSLSLCMAAFAGIARAESIGPALEQEFNDAKAALESAGKEPVEKYAAAQMKQAQDSLRSADIARQDRDATKFSRSARMARAYAELAIAMADSAAAADALASTSEALRRAKFELDQLTKQR